MQGVPCTTTMVKRFICPSASSAVIWGTHRRSKFFFLMRKHAWKSKCQANTMTIKQFVFSFQDFTLNSLNVIRAYVYWDMSWPLLMKALIPNWCEDIISGLVQHQPHPCFLFYPDQWDDCYHPEIARRKCQQGPEHYGYANVTLSVKLFLLPPILLEVMGWPQSLYRKL